MKKLLLLFSIVLLLDACTSESGEKANRPQSWIGDWSAEWKTLPESYPGVEDMEFFMNGKFTFTKDSLTVLANGYPGCIFNIDTLSHTQSWRVSNDTLYLINDPSMPGMTYQIKSQSERLIELQLMEDIFVTLTK